MALPTFVAILNQVTSAGHTATPRDKGANMGDFYARDSCDYCIVTN